MQCVCVCIGGGGPEMWGPRQQVLEARLELTSPPESVSMIQTWTDVCNQSVPVSPTRVTPMSLHLGSTPKLLGVQHGT